MKELSIEEKAKRYDEAFKEASVAYKDEDRHLKATLERIFPELKESEDEKIRKAIYNCVKWFGFDSIHFKYVSQENCLAWLEKQGGHAKFINGIQVGDKVTRNEDGVLVNLSQLNRVAKKDEKQCEQKPADKVEPKFHEGDWLCENEPNNYARFIQILETVNVQGKERYRISRDIHNDEDIVEFGFVEKYYHKFDIQDAKDGDVLYAKGNYFKEYLFMFSSVTEDNVISTHFGYDVFHRTFDKKLTRFGREEDFMSVTPAMKEQRDLLFQKMKESGYEWDAEKKELNKIEQNPAWSEEDEMMLECVLDKIGDLGTGEMCKEWLKSLKERYTWKPSDEQMRVLDLAIRCGINRGTIEETILVSLFNELKKL